MGVWNDRMLRAACEHYGLVTPYDPKLINPASIDLLLGGQYRRTHPHWADYNKRNPEKWADVPLWGDPVTLELGESFWLQPGEFVLCHSLETVNIPLNACAILYSKSSSGRKGLEHLHCLAGDTLIDAPRDLSIYPDGIPVVELAKRNEQFLTYVFDQERMVFTLAPAIAMPARQQTKVVRVDYEWMTGSKWHYGSLTCTPDHRLLSLAGSWLEARNALGVRLRPFGRGIKNYAYINPFPLEQRTVREHRFVAEFLYGEKLIDQETHHADGNKLNNSPANLLFMKPGEHQRLHSLGSNNPFYGKQHSIATREHLSRVRRAKQRIIGEITRQKLSEASRGTNNPRYLDLSLATIVTAYQTEGSLEKAALQLDVNTGTLARKIKEYGYTNTVALRHALQAQTNHKVTAVTELDELQDTYDLHVPGYENFVANGVVVHNSGYGDPAFNGQWTWEFSNVAPKPLELIIGGRYMQMVLEEMVEEPERSYAVTGRYQNQTGATPARDKG